VKGERILAELVALLGMVVYGVILQHIYAEVMGKPERSWVNQVRAWWVTRGSRELEKRLAIWNSKLTAEEPKPPLELD
jgi:hypothetical protein